jgi:hypothetical protein
MTISMLLSWSCCWIGALPSLRIPKKSAENYANIEDVDVSLFIIAACVILAFVIASAYYRLKSKGYPPKPFIVTTLLFSALSLILGCLYPPVLFFIVICPMDLLCIASVLRPRKGSPGKEYLKIISKCHKCGEAIVFDREDEGQAAVCPCGEIMDIPMDEASSNETIANQVPPMDAKNGSSDELITIGHFLNAEQAQMLQIRLQGEGIDAVILGDLMPHVYAAADWADGGVRLAVPANELVKAKDVLSRPEEETRLPDDFNPPQSADEEIKGSGLGVRILISLFLMVWMPVIATGVWEIGRYIFTNEPVRHRSIEEETFFKEAFAFSALFVLIIFVRAFLRSRNSSKESSEADR